MIAPQEAGETKKPKEVITIVHLQKDKSAVRVNVTRDHPAADVPTTV